jgi:MFS family permease
MATYVSLPYQLWHATHSYIAAALLGVIQIVPLIFASTYGGVMADHYDRQKIVWLTEAAAMGSIGILFINSLLSHPSVLVIYFVGALYTTVNGLQTPSLGALAPQIVSHDDQPAANALSSLRSNIATLAGPTLGGLMITAYGVKYVYLLNLITFSISVFLLRKIKKVPIANEGKTPSFSAAKEGFKYAWQRKDLLGTYAVDMLAMALAMPTVLFPAWAEVIHKNWALGLFYSAGTVGALLVALLSGAMGRFFKHGRGVIIGALIWGLAISLSAIGNNLIWILFALILAGGADMISVYYRGAIWNQSIPDDFRGRLASIEQLSYSLGPLLGQLRAASMAKWGSLHSSILYGGLICIISIALTSIFLPKMWNYDVRSDLNVELVKKQRAESQNK